MTYKSNDKSFFEDIFEKPVEEVKEEINELEKKHTKKFLRLYDFGFQKLRAEIKKRPAQFFFLFVTSFFGSVLTSAVALFIFSGNMIALFAAPQVQPEATKGVQVATSKVEAQKYDPLLLASKLKKKESDMVIIDIRPVDEYVAGHIVTAINIPVYGTNLVDKAGDITPVTIKETFKNYLGAGKLVIIYAQNSYATIPSDIAAVLSEGEMKVKALAVGWEEWKHLNK